MGAFKGWQSTVNNKLFSGFPNRRTRSTNYRFGFSSALLDWDPRFNINSAVNDGLVSTWRDTISNLILKSPTVGNSPLYVSSFPSFNNFPAVNMNLDKTILLSDSHWNLPGQITIAIVYKLNGINSAVNTLLSSNVGSAQGRVLAAVSAAPLNGAGLYDGVTPVLNSTISDTAAHIVVISNRACVVDGVVYSSGAIRFRSPFKALGTTTSNTGQNALSNYGRLTIFGYSMSSTDCVALCNQMNNQYLVY